MTRPFDPRPGRPEPDGPPRWLGALMAAGALASLAIVGMVVALAVAAIDWIGRQP